MYAIEEFRIRLPESVTVMAENSTTMKATLRAYEMSKKTRVTTIATPGMKCDRVRKRKEVARRSWMSMTRMRKPEKARLATSTGGRINEGVSSS